MIKYYDGLITDLLGPNYRADPEVQALAYAIRAGTRLLFEYIAKIAIYYNIDGLPENILDFLAVELRALYYDTDFPIDTKRKIIKESFSWFSRAGTAAAVEEFVAAVYGEGDVIEWFDYGDDPFYFKIVTNAILTEDMNSRLSKLIRKVKNVRSHLRTVEVYRTTEKNLYAGAATVLFYKPAAIMDGYNIGRSFALQEYAAAASMGDYRPAAIIDGYEETRSAALQEIPAALAEFNHRPPAIIDGYTKEAETIAQRVFVLNGALNHSKNITITKEGGL